MLPCSSCHRHVLDTEASCPFCGARLRTIGAGVHGLGVVAIVAATMLGATACAARPGSAEDGMTTTTNGGSTTADTTSASESESETTQMTTLGDGDGDPTDDSNVSLSFYACSDPYDFSISECDPFYQDCPDGEKCVAYASTGGQLDANKCVPITGGGQTGDPCTYAGPVEATDDCDADNYCFNVIEIDGMPVGTCVAFCTGTADDPICADGQGCFNPPDYDGSLAICLPSCDPLLQDCVPEQMCVWDHSEQFLCVNTPDPVPGNGEDCGDFPAGCALGLLCANGDYLPDCGSGACCTEYCDVSDVNFTCSNPNYGCISFWLMDPAPPEYVNVGICAVIP